MKLVKVAVAALVMVAMAVPVIAEDRLSLSGEMRTRAFHTDVEVDDKSDGTDTWANQRLRIAGNIAVAEGVSVTFRTDITEGTNWGDSSSFGAGPGNPERSNGFGHARSGSQQQWDRAHLDLTKGMFHLRAGQQYVGTGGTWAIDTQDSGLALDIKTGAPIKTFFIVDKDNGSLSNSDAYLYGVVASPKFGNAATKFIASGYSDSFANREVYMLGASVTLPLDAFKLFAELDYFTGDHNDAANVDAFGTQLFVDGSLAVSDALSVGGQFFYALGDDKDVQYVRLGNGFNGWDPIMDVGTSLSNEEITFGNPFDFTGMNAGVVGARLYGNMKLSDALSMGASAAYLETEDDDASDSDTSAFALGMNYAVMANTSFQVQLQYEDGEYDNVDYNAFKAGSGIFVKF